MYPQSPVAAREKLFTMRMSADEMARLEHLAAHFGLTVAGTIRLLAKEKHDALVRPVFDPLQETFADEREVYENVLTAILGAKVPLGAPAENDVTKVEKYRDRFASTDEIVRHLKGWGWGAATWKAKRLPRLLNELRAAGYITKRSAGYTFTTRGEAFFEAAHDHLSSEGK